MIQVNMPLLKSMLMFPVVTLPGMVIYSTSYATVNATGIACFNATANCLFYGLNATAL